MKVSELLETRWANWRELDRLCTVLAGPWGKTVRAEMVTRMAALYRGACADLALADAYQLPPGTIDYLHRLVGKAHNQLYRSRRFAYGLWFEELLVAQQGKVTPGLEWVVDRLPVQARQVHADLARHGAFEDEGFAGSGGHGRYPTRLGTRARICTRCSICSRLFISVAHQRMQFLRSAE